MTGSFILNVTYGIDVQSANDPYIRIANESVQAVVNALVPGAFLVDTLPIRALL